MAVWRHTAHVIGVPDALLFHGQEEGVRSFRVATACEPPPDLDAVAMANSIVNSVSVAVDVADSIEGGCRRGALRLPRVSGN